MENKKINLSQVQAETVCKCHHEFLKKYDEFLMSQRELYENMAKDLALEALTGAEKDRKEREERVKRYMESSRAFESAHQYLCRLNMDNQVFSLDILIKL